jgi:hypothetical protein
MKKLFWTSLFCFWGLVFFENCGESNKEKEIMPNKYKSKSFDLDSSLSLMIPADWDSTEYLKYPSYEYKYYLKVKPKNTSFIGIFVKRLKFKVPTLELKSLFDLLKLEITTDPAYTNCKILISDTTDINGKRLGTLLYYVTFKEKACYEGRFFFINADSSNTVGEIRTQKLDSTSALAEIKYMLHSIKIK